ncbi:MAG TPA: MbnP family protein [Bacteroidia bacterium]
MKKLSIVILSCIVLAIGCKKDAEVKQLTPAEPTGFMKLEFNNMFDTLELALDTVNYVLDNGDKLTFTKFKYYISNIKLTATDGSVYSEQESYYLVDEAKPESWLLTIKKVPFKEYTSISFVIGVDSARNVSGSQTGALSENNDMFWTWSTGYIMTKLEGTSMQSNSIGGLFGFHIGGFSGANSGLRTVHLPLNGNTALVKDGKIPSVHIKCNVKEWFVTPVELDLSSISTVTTVNATSKMIADNYKDMFSVTDVH